MWVDSRKGNYPYTNTSNETMYPPRNNPNKMDDTSQVSSTFLLPYPPPRNNPIKMDDISLVSSTSFSLPRVSVFKDGKCTAKVYSRYNNVMMPRGLNNDDFVSKAWPSILDGSNSAIGVSDSKCSDDILLDLSGGCSLDPVEPPIPRPPARRAEFTEADWPIEVKMSVNPFKYFYEPRSPRPLEVVHRPAAALKSNKADFSYFAKLALDYFNSSQNVDFKFVEVTGYGINFYAPKSTIHINFVAESLKGEPELFYADLDTPDYGENSAIGVDIRGCSMLMKVDIGNPLGLGCGICESDVLHPGPRYGYIVSIGDKFEDSSFWRYGSPGLSRAKTQQLTARNIEMYTICAKKAIEHLKCKVADLELVTVVAAIDDIQEFGIVIHVNFLVMSGNGAQHKLCFAELSLPFFECDSPTKWVPEKEAFLEVKGCCILEKDYNASEFGRVCYFCNEQVIHPGPKYGYQAAVGDQFEGYEFKNCGVGIF